MFHVSQFVSSNCSSGSIFGNSEKFSARLELQYLDLSAIRLQSFLFGFQHSFPVRSTQCASRTSSRPRTPFRATCRSKGLPRRIISVWVTIPVRKWIPKIPPTLQFYLFSPDRLKSPPSPCSCLKWAGRPDFVG